MKESIMRFILSIMTWFASALGIYHTDPVDPYFPSIYYTEEQDVSTDEAIDENSIEFTVDKQTRLFEYLKDKTSINFMQVSSNISPDGTTVASSTFDIKVDTENKIVFSNITLYDNGESKQYSLASDYLNNFHCKKENHEWFELTESTVGVDWDLSEYDSALSCYRDIVGNHRPHLNMKGYTEGNYEYYTYEFKPYYISLKGLVYDKIEKEVVEYKIYSTPDEYSLYSVVSSIYYKVGSDTYIARTQIQFNEFGTRSLSMPMNKPTEEDTKEEKVTKK